VPRPRGKTSHNRTLSRGCARRKLRISASGKKFFTLLPTYKSLPQLLGQDFVVNFVTYTRVYTVVKEHSTNVTLPMPQLIQGSLRVTGLMITSCPVLNGLIMSLEEASFFIFDIVVRVIYLQPGVDVLLLSCAHCCSNCFSV